MSRSKLEQPLRNKTESKGWIKPPYTDLVLFLAMAVSLPHDGSVDLKHEDRLPYARAMSARIKKVAGLTLIPKKCFVYRYF